MEKTQGDIRCRSVRFWLFLTVLLSVFFSYEMGNRYFADPDEGRYVEIPREMVVTGDYVTPKLNGLKYFEKPVLFYWMQSAVIHVFGMDENSMRLWPIVFAILGCLSVFLVGYKTYSTATGLISAGILATNIIYYSHSRLIILDLVNAVLMSGSLWCFFIAFVKNDTRKIWRILMYIFSALACLTKGLIGAVLPAFVVLLWIAFTGNWRKIKEILYIPGILAFLCIFLPWHILVAYRNNEFLYFYFVVEHFLRYTTTMHCRYQPSWFFLPILIAGLLPWTGFTLVALKKVIDKSFKKDSDNIFFACWIFGILGFFSLSHSKLIPYILPIVPPLALITGKMIIESIELERADFKYGVRTNVAILVGALIAYLFARPYITDVLSNNDVCALIYAFIAVVVIIICVLIASLIKRIDKLLCIGLLVFCGANMMWIINKAAPYYQNTKKPTTKIMAQAIKTNRSKNDLVFCYKRYYQDFPVYLNSTVGVVDYIGELEFGANCDKNNDKIFTEESFWNLWNSTKKKIFLLLSRGDYRKMFTEKNIVHSILEFDKDFIVITNK